MKVGIYSTDPRVIICKGTPIGQAPELSERNYHPSGSTALLDAIGMTIDEVGKRLSDMPESDRPGKVLFCIITDGQENASTKYSGSKIKEMIELQRNTYSWEFMYLGANQDAFAVSGGLGISPTYSANFVASAVGTRAMYKSVDTMATAYRSN